MDELVSDSYLNEENLSAVEFTLPELEKVRFERDAEHPILKAAWVKLTSHDLIITGQTNKANTISSWNRFYDFMCSRGYLSITNTPVTIFNEFGVFVSDNADPYRITRPLFLAVEKYFESNAHTLSVEEYDYLRETINSFDLQRTTPAKKPTLSMMFEDCPFSDSELLVSLRLVCANIICIEQEVKDEILSDPCCEFLKELKPEELKKSSYYTSINSIAPAFKSFIGPVMEAIAVSDNDWAKECILTEFFNNGGHNFDLHTGNVTAVYDEFTSGRTRTKKRLITGIQKKEIQKKWLTLDLVLGRLAKDMAIQKS
jgi:hypothetical protein